MEKDFYVIEDDYDSEFRYAVAPISPIYSMDSSRVIYVGTFSKTLFPALRLGFAILPKPLQARWKHHRMYMDVQNPVLEQAALAEFLNKRKLDKHVQRMRRVYGEKEAYCCSRSSALSEAPYSLGEMSPVCMWRFNFREWSLGAVRTALQRSGHKDRFGIAILSDSELPSR